MPPIPKIYVATNIFTEKRVTGKAKELAEFFKCRVTHINRCELDGNLIKGIWKITKIED